MYTRRWDAADGTGRFTLMYATYYPKFMLELVPGEKGGTNGWNYHKHFWTSFTMFLKMNGQDKVPYACAWRERDGKLLVFPWTKCYIANVGVRPLITADRGHLNTQTEFTPDLDTVKQNTFPLAIWEYLQPAEMDNFNSVDWSPARCLMQDTYFVPEMQELYKASQTFV